MTVGLLSASAVAAGLLTVPQSAAVVGLVTVTLKLAPGARLAMSQCRTLLTIVHSALSGFSAHSKPGGRVSSMSTLVAVPVPGALEFETVIVKLIGLPALTVPPSGVLLMVRLGHWTV